MKHVAATVLMLSTLVGPAAGQEADPDLGSSTFVDACAGCHGPQARGDGPKSAMLSVPVPDLTTFARRNGGEFDRARIVRLIDGREGLSAHGGPMPMYGGLLTGKSAVIDAPDGSPVATTEPILAIVDWLATLQE